MRYPDLYKINNLYFSPRQLASALGIDYNSDLVSCSRYAKAGLIIRIKRNFYVLRDKWVNLSVEEQFAIANIMQVPSYISLTTALAYYGISTQIQRNFIESISIKRTRNFSVQNVQFSFLKLKELYYNNFLKKDTFFIASPEKALVDSLHLVAFNKYRLDLSAVDINKLDRKYINKLLKQYPQRVRKLAEKSWTH